MQIGEGPKFVMGSKTILNEYKLRTETGPGQYEPRKP